MRPLDLGSTVGVLGFLLGFASLIPLGSRWGLALLFGRVGFVAIVACLVLLVLLYYSFQKYE